MISMVSLENRVTGSAFFFLFHTVFLLSDCLWYHYRKGNRNLDTKFTLFLQSNTPSVMTSHRGRVLIYPQILLSTSLYHLEPSQASASCTIPCALRARVICLAMRAMTGTQTEFPACL